MMKNYQYITLREMPSVKEQAAEWFHSKWGVPKEAYLECMNAYLEKRDRVWLVFMPRWRKNHRGIGCH